MPSWFLVLSFYVTLCYITCPEFPNVLNYWLYVCHLPNSLMVEPNGSTSRILKSATEHNHNPEDLDTNHRRENLKSHNNK
jgi:hypothetical protein